MNAATVPLAQRCPAFTPVQAYGLGFPSVFIQGFGNPQSDIQNRPIAFFGQGRVLNPVVGPGA